MTQPTRLLPILLLSLSLSTPAGAQDTETAPEDGFAEGLDLLRDGSRLIFENLLDEMRPTIDEVQPFFEEEMLPFLERLGDVVDDLSAYELPERLPNGDILIRRRPDAPSPPPLPDPDPDAPAPTPEDPVDL